MMSFHDDPVSRLETRPAVPGDAPLRELLNKAFRDGMPPVGTRECARIADVFRRNGHEKVASALSWAPPVDEASAASAPPAAPPTATFGSNPVEPETFDAMTATTKQKREWKSRNGF
jgi:hypothetical protein